MKSSKRKRVEGDTSLGQHIALGGGGFNGLQQGMIFARNGSMIQNSRIGIRNYGPDGYSTCGGMIRCEGTSFINNTIGAEFGPYQNINSSGQPVPSLGSFRNCSFLATDDYFIQEPFFGFVRMRKADGMRFAGCDFINEIIPELPSEVAEFGFGLHAVSSGFEVYPIGTTVSTPLCESPCVVSDSTRFSGLGHGVYVLTFDMLRPFSIYQAAFTNCYRGLTSIGTSGGFILYNTFYLGQVPSPDFTIGQIGLELGFNQEGFELQENTFIGVNPHNTQNTLGLLVNSIGNNDNIIRRNFFLGLETSIQSFGVNGDTSALFPRGLVYLCNTFDNTLSQGYDFHIPNTPVLDIINPYQTPGAPNGQEISSGNNFAYTSHDYFNYENFEIRYFYDSLGINEEPRDSLFLGITKSQSNLNECITDYCAPPCIVDIEEFKADYNSDLIQFNQAYEDIIDGLSTQNNAKIIASRSKGLFYRKSLSKSAFLIVHHILSDSAYYNLDSLILWLEQLDTYGSDVIIAGLYASQKDFNSSINILQSIQNRRTLTSLEQDDIESIIDIYNILDSIPIEELTTANRNLLRTISNQNKGISSSISRSILSFFNEYIPLPYYDGQQIKFRTEALIDTSTEETLKNKSTLQIFPNPTQDYFTIRWDNDSFKPRIIKIYNTIASPVFEYYVPDPQEEYQAIISGLSEGIYFLIAADDWGKIETHKLLIQK